MFTLFKCVFFFKKKKEKEKERQSKMNKGQRRNIKTNKAPRGNE